MAKESVVYILLASALPTESPYFLTVWMAGDNHRYEVLMCCQMSLISYYTVINYECLSKINNLFLFLGIVSGSELFTIWSKKHEWPTITECMCRRVRIWGHCVSRHFNISSFFVRYDDQLLQIALFVITTGREQSLTFHRNVVPDEGRWPADPFFLARMKAWESD